MKSEPVHDLRKRVFEVIGIALLYFVVARLSLLLAFGQTNASPVWPPSGIAFAAVLLWGYRIWPGIMAGAFFSNVVVFLINKAAGVAVITTASFFISIGNTLEAVTGGILLHHLIGIRNPMDRVQDIFKFVCVAMVMCLVSSAVGPALVCLTGIVPWSVYQTVWFTWWLGDTTGILTLAPIFLIWYQHKQPLIPWGGGRLIEFIFFLTVVFLIHMSIFYGNFGMSAINYPMVYMPILLVVWTAFRFGQLGVAVAILMMLSMAILGTIQGRGPFVTEELNRSLLLLQFFIGIVTITGLTLTAALNERQRAEAALRKSEERFHGIYNSSMDAIGYVDLDGVLLDVNDAFTKLTGYSRAELLSGRKKFQDLTPGQYHEFEEKKIEEVCSTEEPVEYEKEYIKKDGSRVPVLLTTFIVRGSDGNAAGLAAIIKDISEQKKAYKEMQEAVRIKSEFTSTVSHELRTPLAIAKEALSLLLREKVGKIFGKQREILSMANSNLDRLGTLINDILDFSKIEAGKMELHQELIDIIPLVEECCEEWKLEANVKKIKLESLMPPGPIRIYVDKIRLLQILSNLIHNAIKFSTEQGRVEVSLEERENFCQFSVKDTGPGIAQEDFPKLFQRFQQLGRNHGPGGQGTGLGLSIIKSLVELHGGQVRLESALGQGATFIFTIPKAKGLGCQNEKVAYAG